jgi:CRP/FNR family cyclic AMP-dependent transcriptional regulator
LSSCLARNVGQPRAELECATARLRAIAYRPAENLLFCGADANDLHARAAMTRPRPFRGARSSAPQPAAAAAAAAASAAAGGQLAASLFDYDGRRHAEADGDLTFLGERDEHDWEILLGYAELRRFAPGEVVIQRGAHERALYLVTAGVLEVRPDERGTALTRYTAPSVVGEIAFLDGGARLLDIAAVTAGEVHRLNMDGFEALAARHPELARAILFDLGRIAATRLRRLMDSTPGSAG